MPIHLTEDEFADLVDQAMASLPDAFRPYMENIIVEVHPRPRRAMLADLKIPRDSRLLGLYQGVPVTKKSVTAPFEYPERILIFKLNVEAVCRSRQAVVDEVRKTVLHEVGHHFGMSEEDLDKLGYG